MTRHELKTDPDVFDAVARGVKTHEIRLNDRNFAAGDELLLRETQRTGALMATGVPLLYTGRELVRTVSHILTGYGLLPGWCILSFAASEAPADPPPCDPTIHQNGAVVAVLDAGKLAMEGLVHEANRIEPGMDWHYFGGRAVVKTLGDVAKARAALVRAMPTFIDGGAS